MDQNHYVAGGFVWSGWDDLGEPSPYYQSRSSYSGIIDLSYITVKIIDKNGLTVPTADNPVKFNIKGPGEIVATADGYQADMEPFPSHERKAFNGSVMAIIRSELNEPGTITVTAESPGLTEAQAVVTSY